MQQQETRAKSSMDTGVRAMFAADPLSICWEINVPINERNRHEYLTEVSVRTGQVTIVKNAP